MTRLIDDTVADNNGCGKNKAEAMNKNFSWPVRSRYPMSLATRTAQSRIRALHEDSDYDGEVETNANSEDDLKSSSRRTIGNEG